MSELGYKGLLFSSIHPSVYVALLCSTGVSLLVVHALELSVPACKAERITATLSSISTPTDHLSTASVWELTSTLIQQSINHNWLKAIPVSGPSMSEGGSVHKQHQQPPWPAFMERDESFHACFRSSHFPLGTDLIYDFCSPHRAAEPLGWRKSKQMHGEHFPIDMIRRGDCYDPCPFHSCRKALNNNTFTCLHCFSGKPMRLYGDRQTKQQMI